MNSVFLIGRLARDPEIRYGAGSQSAVCNLTLAVDRGKDRDGKDLGADFIRIVVFGKQGENCERYLEKGRQVAVQGKIRTGSYVNKDGATVYTTDVVADRVEFLGSGDKSGGSNGGVQRSYQPSAPAQAQETAPAKYDDMPPDGFSTIDEDIPF